MRMGVVGMSKTLSSELGKDNILINVIGPLTDAGLNPARDIMPRLWAACVGWGSICFGNNIMDTICVYVVGPFVGGIVAALAYRYILKPMHLKKDEEKIEA